VFDYLHFGLIFLMFLGIPVSNTKKIMMNK